MQEPRPIRDTIEPSALGRDLQDAGRYVDTDDVRALQRQPDRQRPAAGADLEHPVAGERTESTNSIGQEVDVLPVGERDRSGSTRKSTSSQLARISVGQFVVGLRLVLVALGESQTGVPMIVLIPSA